MHNHAQLMEFQGVLSTKIIERRVFEVEASEKTAWIREVLLRSAPNPELTGMEASEWAAKSTLRVAVRIEKADGDFVVTGSLEGRVPAPCSRCGDPFLPNRKSEFRVVLHPVTALSRDALVDDSGDADYVFLRGPDIDVVELIREQLIVLEPVAECPELNGDGKCAVCLCVPSFLGPDAGSAGQIPQTEANTRPFANLF